MAGASASSSARRLLTLLSVPRERDLKHHLPLSHVSRKNFLGTPGPVRATILRRHSSRCEIAMKVSLIRLREPCSVLRRNCRLGWRFLTFVPQVGRTGTFRSEEHTS